jgi:hypothetical protein
LGDVEEGWCEALDHHIKEIAKPNVFVSTPRLSVLQTLVRNWMGTLARIDSDITDYDYSTDSESLRFFFSETDPSGTHGTQSTI